MQPSGVPSHTPTLEPSHAPSFNPTPTPTNIPTIAPSEFSISTVLVPKVTSVFSYNSTNSTLVPTSILTQLTTAREVFIDNILTAEFQSIVNITISSTLQIQRTTHEIGNLTVHETKATVNTTAAGFHFYYRIPWTHNATLHNCTQIQLDNNFSADFTDSCRDLNDNTRGYKEDCLDDRYTSVTTMFNITNITNDIDGLNRLFYVVDNTTTLVAFDACLQSGFYETLRPYNATLDSIWGYMNNSESHCSIHNQTQCMEKETVEYQLLLLYFQYLAAASVLDVNHTIDGVFTFAVREPTVVHAVALVPSTPTSTSSGDKTILYISLGVAGGTIVLGLAVWFAIRQHTQAKSSTSLYEFL